MAHDNSKLAALLDLGQSVWLDFISRDLLRSGRLDELVSQGVGGMTTNPTIFDKAIGKGDSYDEQIEDVVARGRPTAEIVDALIVADVQTACDLLRPVYEHTGHLDGYVSIEVPPALAYDTRKTVNEAHRLHGAVDRPNLMVKIPGTRQGLAAIRQTIAGGLNINVTLLFALEVYEGVIDAYLGGLEDRVARGEPIDEVRSVASFFVSRVDVKADQQIDEKLADQADRIVGARLESPQGHARRGQRQARLSAFSRDILNGALAQAGRARRPGPASAVGQHRRQEPGLRRPALRRQPDRAADGQHHARRHAAGVSRPRRRASHRRPGFRRGARPARPGSGAGAST